MRLAVLASQAGSTFEAIERACRDGVIPAEIVLLLCNNPRAAVLTKAQQLGIACVCLDPGAFSSWSEWDEKVCEELLRCQPDLIVLAGFLKKLGPATIRRFQGKIINTHPSLLPKYGGQGMYGRRVHEAVISSGDKVTGVSLHLVNEDYDQGKLIAKVEIPVLNGDTPEALEARVKAQEKIFLVECLADICEGRLIL